MVHLGVALENAGAVLLGGALEETGVGVEDVPRVGLVIEDSREG